MIRKLRIKVIIVLMTVFTLMLSAMLGMLLQTTKRNLERENAEFLRSLALSPHGRMRPDEMNTEGNVRLPFFVIDIDEKGEIVSTSGDFFDLSDADMVEDLIAQVESETAENFGEIKEYGLRYLKNSMPGGRTTIVFSDDSFSQHTMKELEKGAILIGITAFLVFGFLSWVLARWMVSPVEKAFTQQKQFVSDASHELKTPLTVIMTNAQMLQEPSYAEQQRLQFVSSILQMSEQMRGLVENMLDLSRMEKSEATLEMKEVDFSTLCEDALLPFEPVFFEKELTLNSEIEPGIMVKGSSQHLIRLVEILLDNAQKYCSLHAETKLSLIHKGRYCLLSVSNEGEEISPEELKKIFKRFYRVDKARSMNHSYGLGLSIAEEITIRHKGKIWAESNDGKNTFFVQLPIKGK